MHWFDELPDDDVYRRSDIHVSVVELQPPDELPIRNDVPVSYKHRYRMEQLHSVDELPCVLVSERPYGSGRMELLHRTHELPEWSHAACVYELHIDVGDLHRVHDIPRSQPGCRHDVQQYVAELFKHD